MQLTFKDQVTQIYDGYIVHRDEIVYYTDNDFNIIREYNFTPNFVTLDGLIVNTKELTIIDVKKDTFKLCPHLTGLHMGRYLFRTTRDGTFEYYDNETQTFYDRLTIFPLHRNVLFSYARNYETDLKAEFVRYIYTHGKSILTYPSHIEIYEGELYPIERLEDFLEGREEYTFNDEYAQLIKIFEDEYYNRYDPIFLPQHLIFRNTILDLKTFILYMFTIDRNEIIGIQGTTLITKKGPVELTIKRKNHL